MINKKRSIVGIRDIAKKAKVSIGPVDKVLHNRGGVSESTKLRIIQAIEELGYKPNVLASRLKSSKEYTIAIIIPKATKEIPYWSQYNAGFEKGLSELGHFGLNIDLHSFNQTDEASFKKKIDKVIKGDYDGIFVVPMFAIETKRLMRHCSKMAIPVIFFDTDLPGQDNLSYIGRNSIDSGYVAADVMNYCIVDAAPILIINIVMKDDNHFHFSDREKGFRSFFKKTNRTILKYQNTHIHNDQIEKELTSLLQSHPEIKGIFVTNGMNKVAAIIDKLKASEIKLIGYDLILENVYFLQNGVIHFLISQKPDIQAYQGILLFHEYLILKQQINKVYYMPIDIVTSSNLKYYK